tara:strand:+ start:576 stop:752 length:177 start_codon:yes stop_codon:yes gene_type:complete
VVAEVQEQIVAELVDPVVAVTDLHQVVVVDRLEQQTLEAAVAVELIQNQVLVEQVDQA